MGALAGLIACSSSNGGNPAPDDGGGVIVPHQDSGTGDSSTPTGSCAPVPQTNFQPSWIPPAAPRPACTTAQLDSYIQCRIDNDNAPGTTPTSCKPWVTNVTTANILCLKCIETDDSANAWGALVDHQKTGTTNINYAGCFALAEGKTDGSGCGGSVQTAAECTQAACGAACPVDSSGNGLDALNTCIQTAGSGTCATYQTAADNCFNVDSGATQACLGPDPNDFWGNAQVVATVFCGPQNGQPTDAGPEAAPDAPDDTGAHDAKAD
jgi:hypothetical protein